MFMLRGDHPIKHKRPNFIRLGNLFFTLSALAILTGIIWFVLWPQRFTLAALLGLAGFGFIVGPIFVGVCYWLGG